MGRAARRRRAAAAHVAPPPPRPVRRRPIPGWTAWQQLEHLGQLHEERRRLDQEVDEVVHQLRGVGVSWAEIGRVLGLTRQGARQRYGSQEAATAVVVSRETRV